MADLGGALPVAPRRRAHELGNHTKRGREGGDRPAMRVLHAHTTLCRRERCGCGKKRQGFGGGRRHPLIGGTPYGHLRPPTIRGGGASGEPPATSRRGPPGPPHTPPPTVCSSPPQRTLSKAKALAQFAGAEPAPQKLSDPPPLKDIAPPMRLGWCTVVPFLPHKAGGCGGPTHRARASVSAMHGRR